jgi:hypothetical protein
VHTLPRASQKLIAVTTLLRAMPETLTPEERNLRREAHALIEQATVHQVEGSASRIHNQTNVRGDDDTDDQKASKASPHQR